MRITTSTHLLFCAVLAVCSAAPAWAYLPPVDKVGPLTVMIEGPSEVADRSQPISIGVVLENSSDQLLSTAVRIGVIDQWVVEPATPVRLQLGPRAIHRQAFQVRIPERCYKAHYPIHAFVEFADQGTTRQAHPVLILQTTFSNPVPKTVAMAWKCTSVPAQGALALDQLAVRRMLVQVNGEAPLWMPVGVLGNEPRSRADVGLGQMAFGNRNRSVLIMHPAWWEGHIGTVALEYPLELPNTKPITLSFGNAMSPEGQSDGVTFRVRVAPFDASDAWGKVVHERHVVAKNWEDATIDLSAFAGQRVRLQLEAHPGPQNNTGWDRCFWADPLLTVGAPLAETPFPPTDDHAAQRLGETHSGGATFDWRIWPGQRGLLDAAIGIGQGDKQVFVQGFAVTVLGTRLDRPTSVWQLTRVAPEHDGNRLQWRHTFTGPDGTFDLLGSLVLEGEALRARFQIANAPPARPWFHVHLEDVAWGPWSQDVELLYAGVGNVLRKPDAFRLACDGHRLATSFVGYEFANGLALVEAVDTPPLHLDVQPADHHYSLHASDDQTRTLIASRNVWEAAKRWRAINGLKAASGVEKAAGRFVFDLWGGRYQESAEQLSKAFRYGLTDSMVVWHNWQRWGYDYRLPEIYPPNPEYGSTEELRSLIDTCRSAGVLAAVHDNYIDYYPDAAGFSYDKTVAFAADGAPVRAWLNEGRGAQSYRYRSDCAEPILKDNLRLIREGLRPSAYFIDVWSSIRPYDYWTADGQYYSAVYSRDTWGKLFTWIRDFLGERAPQISESGTDVLIGSLDGAQTNHLRVSPPVPGGDSWAVWDWKCADSERVPWFDAAHHDRFALHGAGYESRYTAGLDTRLHGIHSDDYITTEILTGHPAMVPRAFDRQVVRKYWLTHDLMRALALRTIEAVEFVEGDLHRQHVTWSGDGQVWVNRSTQDWTVGETVLPPFGFLARVPTPDGEVTAAIERRDGVIVESCQGPDQYFVNARSQTGDMLPVSLAVEQVTHRGDRTLEFQVKWKGVSAIPKGFVPFLHFVDGKGEIAFQGAQSSLSELRVEGDALVGTATAVLPAAVRPGDSFELCYGLYHPRNGRRLSLAGPDRGDRRIRLGTVTVVGQGQSVEQIAWQSVSSAADPFLERHNLERRVIAFRGIHTAGACRLARADKAVTLTLLPDTQAGFDVSLAWDQLPWKSGTPRQVIATDIGGKVLATTPVSAANGVVTIRCEPNVFQYRIE